MKALLLSSVLASFSWGYDVVSFMTLEGEEYSCQVLTIHNENSAVGSNTPRPSSVDLGLHRVIVSEEPGIIPDTFGIVAGNGWSADQDLVTLEEGETAIINICPMVGA